VNIFISAIHLTYWSNASKWSNRRIIDQIRRFIGRYDIWRIPRTRSTPSTSKLCSPPMWVMV